LTTLLTPNNGKEKKMEIILAIVVASAVIFFGALISMGNERQRKAIDGLREQVVLWAVQDLKIKREHLIQSVHVPDPVEWLDKTASRVCGFNLKLQVVEMFEDPQVLSCISGDGNAKIIFSPLSISQIRRINTSKHNRLSQQTGNPLLNLPKDTEIHELSPLTSGYLADIELTLVWKSLTNQELFFNGSIWLYIIRLK
jgi:hypothetical protein